MLAKHESAWETFGIPSILFPRRMCYVFKKELMYVPFFGWCLKVLSMVPVNRSKGTEAFEQVKTIGGQRLRDGAWMLFHPEGTRVPIGQKKRYKTGGTRLAIETNTPVVPIVHNAADFWPKKGFFKKAGTITVRIGKPIYPDGYTPETMMNEVEQWIEGELKKISPNRPVAATL